jgi:hypothetical protein
MKRLVSLFFLILPAMITNSCLFKNNCVACDIYNSYGTYMEYYGSECGAGHKTNNYEDEAEQYAVDYYGGYAICYEE